MDLDEQRIRLTAWLQTKHPEVTDLRVSELKAPSSGFSNETMLFEASWNHDGRAHRRGMVVRLQPTGPALFPTYDLDIQYRVMKALDERSVVPVPTMLWKEEDATILGAPFFVMERKEGQIPLDDPVFTMTGWVLDLSPERRARLCDNAAQVLADIHAIDWETLDLGFLTSPERGATPLDQLLVELGEFYDWVVEEQRNPVVEAALSWAHENRPTETEPVVLTWGDCRIGNMVFNEDLSVAAVLDWEMASLASPELDLGWWTFALRYFTEGIGAPLPEGFPTSEEFLARYEELTGHEVKHHAYYEILTGLRAAIITHRIALLSIKAGLLPEDSDMALNNGATQVLARLLELPSENRQPAQTFKRG